MSIEIDSSSTKSICILENNLASDIIIEKLKLLRKGTGEWLLR